MKTSKYGLRELQAQFPNDAVCIGYLFDALHTEQCSCGGTYTPLFQWDKEQKKVVGRRQYQCSKCRFQIAPTSGTIFHKSDTPLTLWFHAIWVFSNAKSGISAKEMERQLNVTYKTAWRILSLIRKALGQDGKLRGTVEMDTGYFGGRFKSGKDNKRQKEATAAKSVVMGAVERGGEVRAQVVMSSGARVHGEFIEKYIEKGARLMTDGSLAYKNVAVGYDRHSVKHRAHEYVRGDVYVNTMEGFWSHVKRSIKGTHKVVSKAYLQAYLDGFAFHYNNRHNDRERFGVLLGTLLRGAEA